MKKFLSEAAEKIINNKYYGVHSVVILPNKRSEIFLLDELKKKLTSNIWLPEFYAINEFVQKISGLTKADNISIFFDLYKFHSKIEGNNAKTIDEFLTWAPVMLSDFNDIDNAVADAADIFTQLSAVVAMQQWNPDGRPLTLLQQNYLRFFNSMFTYYSELHSKLIADKSGYQGLINRYAAGNIPTLLGKQSWDNYLFVGLNALSESEIQIVDYINKNRKTDFIWDVDEYYYPKNNKIFNRQEAGKQIKRVINRLKISGPDNIGNKLSSSKKNIKILGVPKNIGQVKFVGQQLKEMYEAEVAANNKNNDQLVDSAIVLANEDLLVPLLNSLPDLPTLGDKYYNVTLGYPLSNSEIEHFFSSWIDFIISKTKDSERINTRQLILLLNNPIIKQNAVNNSNVNFINYLISKNISVITSNDVKNSPFFSDKSDLQFVSDLLNLDDEKDILIVIDKFRKILISITGSNFKINFLINEQVKQLIKIISKITLLSADNKSIINYNAIKKIVGQLISSATINLVGKPLNGIQIMGLLETRNLDFKNVTILSTNEGIIPKTDSVASFIPMDIRRQRKLPLPSDRAEIYAYHFYRLLQRAENISLIYNSEADNMGSGEKSRFIQQIENELLKINKSITLSNTVIATNISIAEDDDFDALKIVIPKSKQILKKLADIAKSGYSPSALSTYISCPLKYYYAYVAKINTVTELEQTVEANTFGTVVHAVLEEIYKPMTDKNIEPVEIKKVLPHVHQLLKNQFKQHYNNSLNSGKNLLIFEVAQSYIVNFLKWDIKNITMHPSVLQSTELRLIINIINDSLNVNFKGFIDRVDKIHNTVKIIDYKTGSVELKNLKVKNADELTTNPKYAKAFQVMYYAWLYNQQYNVQNIETGIISLRRISGGFISLKLSEYEDIKDYFDKFTDAIIKLVGEISDSGISFTQTDDLDICRWCNYKTICNR